MPIVQERQQNAFEEEIAPLQSVPSLKIGANRAGQVAERLLAERITPALQTLFDGDDENVQNWLRKSNWHLGDISPLDAIHDGNAQVVAEMLEERLAGQPS